MQSLDDYLTELETGDAAGEFRGFLTTFSKTLQSDQDDDEQIFNALGSIPSVFDDNVSKTLQLTINEASECYNHKCSATVYSDPKLAKLRQVFLFKFDRCQIP